MDFSCQASLSLVSLQSQIKLTLVSILQFIAAEKDWATLNQVLGHRNQLSQDSRLHRAANSVVALDVWILDTVDKEVFSDHTRIVVPKFHVGDGLVVDRSEGKSARCVIDWDLVCYDKKLILNELLVFNHANDKGLYDIKSGLGVMMWHALRNVN